MTKTPDELLIPIGYIRKSHGIRGELSFAFAAEDPDLLRGEVFLLPPGASSRTHGPDGEQLSSFAPRPVAPGAAEKFTIERVRAHHGSVLILFKEVHDRTAAELLRGSSVLVPQSRLAPLEEDEVFLFDLPGMRVLVVDEEGGNEREIGVITSVDIPSGQELWTITTPGGQEILFPAVDEFVLDIDLASRTARIAPPPGLLELYVNTQ